MLFEEKSPKESPLSPRFGSSSVKPPVDMSTSTSNNPFSWSMSFGMSCLFTKATIDFIEGTELGYRLSMISDVLKFGEANLMSGERSRANSGAFGDRNECL